MKCYHCDRDMASGSAKFYTWGDRNVVAHRTCDRDALIERASALGCFENPETVPDQKLIDAIAAELLSGEWLARLEKLPTEEAQRAAVRKLAVQMRGER